MTELDPPYACPHCGGILQEIKDHAGRTVRVRKGWTRTSERNRLIRERYQELVRESRPSMIAIKIVAHEFCLGEKAIEAVIYSRTGK